MYKAVLARAGNDKISSARRAIERLEEYASSGEGREIIGPALYPLTEDKVFMALSAFNFNVQTAAGDGFKHTSALGLLKSLKAASRLFRLNLDPKIFDSERLALLTSRPPDALEKEADVAHLPLAAFAELLVIALGNHSEGILGAAPRVSSPFVISYARAFVVMALCSLRSVEAERSCFAPTSDSSPLSETVPAFVTIHCAGGKPRNKCEMLPFSTRVPCIPGLLGLDSWLPRFAAHMSQYPYLFPNFIAPRGSANDIFNATAFTLEAAPRRRIDESFKRILASLGWSLSSQTSSGITLYGCRHLLPDLARVMAFPKEDRDELGRWEASTAVDPRVTDSGSTPAKRRRSSKSSSSNLYARGEAALHREMFVRSAVLARISPLFSSPRDWRDRIPAQKTGGPISFDFVCATPSEASEIED